MGWTIQPTTLVTFDNVRVHEKNRIGNEGDGFKIAMKAFLFKTDRAPCFGRYGN